MDRKRMVAQLILHEGLKLQKYRDTLGNWTIGIGYNLTARGTVCLEEVIGHPLGESMTEAEAFAVCRADIVRVEHAVIAYLPEYASLDPVRQRVVLDLAYNLGFGALNFKRCVAAIKRRDWSTAARELWKSKWSTQVGDGPGKKFDRADRLTQMLLTGEDYVR